jgi:hypothetical protein
MLGHLDMLGHLAPSRSADGVYRKPEVLMSHVFAPPRHAHPKTSTAWPCFFRMFFVFHR